MKIYLYDTTGRWWELADIKDETVAKLSIPCILWGNEDMRDFVKVYPTDENGTFYEGNPTYLLCDHIVAYEVIGQEDKKMTERTYEKDGTLLKPKEEIIHCKNCRFQGEPITDSITPCTHEKGLLLAKDENFCPYGMHKESEE